jgi:hypothetical protein
MRNSRIGIWPIGNSKLSEISTSNYDCELESVMQFLLFWDRFYAFVSQERKEFMKQEE